jgi:hypothetical protein
MEAEFEGAANAFRAPSVGCLLNKRTNRRARREEWRCCGCSRRSFEAHHGQRGPSRSEQERSEAFGGASFTSRTRACRASCRDLAGFCRSWEGTTNVLSLDLLRALAKLGSLRAHRPRGCRSPVAGADPALKAAAETATVNAVPRTRAWLMRRWRRPRLWELTPSPRSRPRALEAQLLVRGRRAPNGDHAK